MQISFKYALDTELHLCTLILLIIHLYHLKDLGYQKNDDL